MSLFGSYTLATSGAFENIIEVVDHGRPHLDTMVAKVFDFGKHPYAQQMAAKAEIRIHKTLSEASPPRFVKYVDSHVTEDMGYLIMEKMDGDLLDLVLNNKLPTTQALSLFQQVCRATEVCHKHSIAHLDIKPENILFGFKNHALHLKLADFGSCVELETKGECFGNRGTVMYSAPEVLRSSKTNKMMYDGKAADIYSLGIVFHVMISGRWPFESSAEWTYRNGQERQLCFSESVSSDQEAMIRSMMSDAPAKRPTIKQVLTWAAKQKVHSMSVPSSPSCGKARSCLSFLLCSKNH